MAPNGTEGNWNNECLISLASGTRSLENVTVLSGQDLPPNAVVGEIAVATPAVGAAVAGNTGGSTITAAPTVSGAKVGVHKFTCTAGGATGTFLHEDPDGMVVDTAIVGTPYTGGGLSLTITDGTPDSAVGDQFTVTVAAGSKKVRHIDFASTVGAEIAVGILREATDASGGDKAAAIVTRDAEVKAARLAWPAGATTDQKNAAIAQLEARGIQVR